MESIKKIIIFSLVLLCIPTVVYAVPDKPPGESGGAPGNSNDVSYNGANTITFDTNEEGKNFSSTTGGENSLLVSGGTSTLTNCSFSKVGDSSGDNADFYGTNAAVLTYNGGVLNIKGGNITTNGSHANAVFAYSNGTINISDAKINTTSNNSGGVMVTGGGTINADNLTVKTLGNSSAAIRSDRGGGTLTVNKGTYETNGMGSPAIYSTANIIVNDANLISNSSEGIVIEGKNSVTLTNTKVEDTNNTLNGNSETYKNIFIYQSMSGDADVGEATFKATDSKFITNKGDTIFVTNTKTTIELENNTITNNDGDFLRVQAGKWGNEGSNGGDVTLNMTNQKVTGNVVLDNISTLNLNMKDKSVLIGAINNASTAKNISVTLSEDSILSLTNDTYLSSLNNSKTDNSNIYSNGKYKLYVGGEEVSINSGNYEEEKNTTTKEKEDNKKVEDENNYLYYIFGGMGVALLVVVIIIIIKKKKKQVY